MKLKKCDGCGIFLIPIKTTEGNIFIHPWNKDCKHADIIKSVELSVNAIDRVLYEQHQELFGKSDYSIEDVFNEYESMVKALADQDKEWSRKYKSLIEQKNMLTKHHKESIIGWSRRLSLARLPWWRKVWRNKHG